MSSPEELAAAAPTVTTKGKWPPKSTPVTWGHMKNLTDAVAIHIEKRLKELRAEIQTEVAEQVAKELRKSSLLRYRGVWSGPAATYRKGDAVTRDGGLWVAVARETNQRPGTGTDWQLAVKSR